MRKSMFYKLRKMCINVEGIDMVATTSLQLLIFDLIFPEGFL